MKSVRSFLPTAMLLWLAAAQPAPAATAPTGLDSRTVEIKTSAFHLRYDLEAGSWSCRWTSGAAIEGASCSVKLADGTLLTPAAYSRHECGPADQTATSDALGKTVKIVVHHLETGKPELRQTIGVYPGRACIVVSVEVVSTDLVASNEMAPLLVDSVTTRGAVLRLDAGAKPRALFVPFDNDKYVRYNSDYASTSHEVTAIYDNDTRRGFVAGSITHAVWKTGLEMKEFGARSLGYLRAYGGVTGEWTHDSQPHGKVSGRTISSPRIFVGFFDDWRDGLEACAAANARLQPALKWNGSPPVGWNSWYALGTHVDLDRTLKISDLFRNRLQPAGFDRDGPVTINLDSYWDNLSEPQLKRVVERLHAAGQKAGIYWTPFTYWGDHLERPVPGVVGNYTFADILLKDAHGAPLPKLDDGHPVDPTHPGAKEWIDWNLERFVRLGFDFIKLDFVNAGALEGVHHDPDVTTGIEAYNVGMRRIVGDLAEAKIGRPFFISLSIAPLFPGGYGHSRRISCDVGSDLGATAYMLNSLTYGWWAGGALYKFNDPDMISLSGSEVEARSRINSSVITGGPILNSDDLTQPDRFARAMKYLTNVPILAVAHSGRTFRPVEGDTGAHAAQIFVRDDKSEGFLVAVFNLDKTRGSHMRLDLARLALRPGHRYRVSDLSTRAETAAVDTLPIELAASESRILRFVY